MRRVEFTKVAASGNDFIIVELKATQSNSKNLAKNICDRRYGVGADGLLVLEKSRVADVRMRIFNADGTEAEMCGNGARCVGLWLKSKVIKIETKAGIIEARVLGENVKIKLTDSKDYKAGLPIKINDRELKINFINTGVPHAVIFVEGIEHIDVSNLGRQIRYYECFAPSGTNVDFVEAVDNDTIKVRTYERGVEDETLACGTGAAAGAIVFGLQFSGAKAKKYKINVRTQGGETLKICFHKNKDKITDIWLEGKVKIVCKGDYYV
ncbi:MAG: diaminopimelate epimerase [Omnitrophica WOR_2 bacterium RIFCSPLOWO2_12_FULL_46_30]|nr:MAG: diaminopimelate epimerase [Omnitrophica WOR_2 bacterium RIFCSPHIGHO2_02_FULL_46_37]OGX42397.1 MAG: diaminopimelate epimerase [Omnitrophica WOR_2 bacterium RIFCSPLOWO2_02_FULL_45_28]OGX50375.1 MAG: diaminopimelate epimerase [Omnitrophica WOR_2 bacterium RIFCSPLOWO2_12_FULL_46_30]